MKAFAISSAAVILFAAAASAGDLAVSSKTLDSMGLGSMQQMSDRDGMAVRGKGPFDNLWLGGNTTNSGLFGAAPSGPRVPGFGGPSLGNSHGDRFLGFGSGMGGNVPTPPSAPPTPPSAPPTPPAGFQLPPFDFQVPQFGF